MMPNKTRLHNLPQLIIEHVIGDYLTEKDKSALILTSKTTQSLFQSHRLQMIANKLLLHVMHGEQKKVEKILKLHPELLEMTGEATDYSGRTFHITAFRFALWAWDTRYMCNMMLDCLPNSPKGEAIKRALLTQFKALEQDGVIYTLNGMTIHEKHYDFSPLIKALQTYVNHYNDWSATNNFDAMGNQWSKVVGLAQRYVPAHVAQHYCDPDESFDPTPQFNKKTFKRALTFYDYITNKPKFWFAPPISSTSGLGVNFGIMRAGLWRQPKTSEGVTTWGRAHRQRSRSSLGGCLDLEAMIALCEVRALDLVPLMQRLKGPIQKPDADHDSEGRPGF